MFFKITFAAFSGLVGASFLKATIASSLVAALPKKVSGSKLLNLEELYMFVPMWPGNTQ